MNSGLIYEDHIKKKMKKNGLCGGKNPYTDGTFVVRGVTYNYECKKEKGCFCGQFSLYWDDANETWKMHDEADYKYPNAKRWIMNSSWKSVLGGNINFLNYIKIFWPKPTDDYATDKRILQSTYSEPMDIQPIADYYGLDKHTPYIQVGEFGLYHTHTDLANIGTIPLSDIGQMRMRARCRYRGTRKSGKVDWSREIAFVMNASDIGAIVSPINLDREEDCEYIKSLV